MQAIAEDETIVDIDFNPDLFNGIYWHLERCFKNQDLRFIWVYGGSSASKTYTIVQLQIRLMLDGENENALVMRKYAVDIRDSIYEDFVGIIKDWGLEELFIIQQNYIRCIATGSYVRFRGLDNSEKIKGITRFKRVIMDEISQFDEADLKQVRKRLRGMPGQQIVGIFNPISEDHWIKTNIFDRQELIEKDADEDMAGMWVNPAGNLVVMQTNYMYNRYIVGPNYVDKHVIADFEEDRLHDPNYYEIYALGNWGKIRTGGEFWKDFKIVNHTGSAPFIPDLPVWLSWDENTNPYLTCLVWQIYTNPINGHKTAFQIDEICLPDPRNRVQHVCAEFIARYPNHMVKGLFVGGDRTSIKEDTKLEKGENFFTQILLHLREYSPTLKMQSANPSVVQSGNFVNQIYQGRVEGVSIMIDKACRRSISDYQYALEDSEGGMSKKKKTNKITGVQYEEYGHPSDAKRYILTMVFAEQYQTYLRGKGKHGVRIGKPVSKNNNY